ncbi:hypothetical protein [Candidatus Stoquefichus sp. SB1]|uniref:hypothetical protein n=1 Tax=Candidatus Stoquefichus sp. SB1 TaxID=1658109 RepID=UPI00067F3CDF|nr:hypothetical protein [Candidatus Stoquefichus sp. SB1]
MKTYALFLLKRIVHRKSNLFLLLGIVLFIFTYLMMNMNSQDILRDTLVDQIKTENETIETSQEKMSHLEDNQTEYKSYKESIQISKAHILQYEESLSFYDQKNWSEFYSSYIQILNQQKQINEDTLKLSNENDLTMKDMSSYIDKQLTYIQYLEANQLDYENIDYPVFGLSFMTSISQVILPLITTICCIYILTQCFTMNYRTNINIDHIIPMSKRKILITKSIVGISISLFIYMFFLLSAFILASVFNQNMGIHYPIMMQNSTNCWVANSLLFVLKQWSILGVLFYIGLSLLIYIFSFFIKEESPLLITGICIILGFVYLPHFVSFIGQISHLSPITYFNYVNVVIGNLAVQLNNLNITYDIGMIVLFVFIVIECICIYTMNFIKEY